MSNRVAIFNMFYEHHSDFFSVERFLSIFYLPLTNALTEIRVTRQEELFVEDLYIVSQTSAKSVTEVVYEETDLWRYIYIISLW